MVNDMIVCIARAEAAGEASQETIIDREGFRKPFAGDLEAVREKIVRVAARVFTSERTVGMDKVRDEIDRFLQRGKSSVSEKVRAVVRAARWWRVVSGSHPSYSWTAFVVLPIENALQSSGFLPPAGVEKGVRRFRAPGSRPVIRQLPALVMIRQPIRAQPKVEHLGILQIKQRVTFETGESSENVAAPAAWWRNNRRTSIGMCATRCVKMALTHSLSAGI
jgi:hypothetical protein